MEKGVSVIICCYNSASRIGETIQFILEQEIAKDIKWEIVIVNNGSSDNTKEIVTEIGRRTAFRLDLIDEPNPGLTNARLKGIEMANYDLLIFCDDDNHLDKKYVENAFLLMKNMPEVGIAGGWVKPKLPFYPGKWIEDFYSALAICKAAPTEGYVHWVFGAGMVMRKQILSKLGNRKISLLLSDRLGSKQTSGGDAEVCYLARFVGYKIYCSNTLVLHHKISAHRLSRWSFIKANFMNVFPVVYFYLLEKLMNRTEVTIRETYFTFLTSRFYNLIYFFPRILIGKYKFYSFIMFFQNTQVLLWLLFKQKRFDNTYMNIKSNLYYDITE